jgi:hypothetical protein
MQKLKFTIKTIDGERREFEEPADLTLGRLRELCFDRFHITPSPGQQWVFQFEGKLFENMDQTLQQIGVKDGSVLIFGTRDVLGNG